MMMKKTIIVVTMKITMITIKMIFRKTMIAAKIMMLTVEIMTGITMMNRILIIIRCFSNV